MISICILNWNCLDTVKTTIQNILGQVGIDFEIIVYDQGSTDGSREFLSQFKSDCFTAILSDKNVGNCESRNEMVRRAKYEYVLLLDSDIVPIARSLEMMVGFMESNRDFAFLGYDFKKYSTNWDFVTKEEGPIDRRDVKVIGSEEYPYRIALTQYGVFRKECLLACPFPTFYPFDQEGWGAEDDVVGQAIVESKRFGSGGIIEGRIYFHNKSSSIKQMGEDTFRRMYMRRFAYLKYYDMFLSPQQKLEALRLQTLPTTKLSCNQYHWPSHKNLGDVATLSAFEENFPFFEFDRDEKRKLLMFGGTIFNHINSANKLHGADFKKILYFGVGVSKQSEIDTALKMIKDNGVSFVIVPRGPKTREMLRASGIPCSEPCGDVLQLLSSRPALVTESGSKNMKVVSIYGSNDFEVDDPVLVRVADDRKSHADVPFVGEAEFFEMLGRCNEVHSSQVHPFFISAMLGKPCRLHPLDWRADDFKYFSSFKLHMSEHESMCVRHEAQKNVQKFIVSFFGQLKWLCD